MKATQERVSTWKVKTTEQGTTLTINGTEYILGNSTGAIVFDLLQHTKNN